jgi:hypothetical protein
MSRTKGHVLEREVGLKILNILTEKEASGYEISTKLSKSGHSIMPKVYGYLEEMAGAGFLKAREERAQNGKPKTVYTIDAAALAVEINKVVFKGKLNGLEVAEIRSYLFPDGGATCIPSAPGISFFQAVTLILKLAATEAKIMNSKKTQNSIIAAKKMMLLPKLRARGRPIDTTLNANRFSPGLIDKIESIESPLPMLTDLISKMLDDITHITIV